MDREHQIYRTTLVGSAGNLLLLVFKFVAGIVGHSSAMMADAIHSLSDFVTDALVLVFVKISARPQDASHDYGHGKYETMATFFIGLVLFGVAVGIFVSGFLKIIACIKGEPPEAPRMIAFWAALISIVVKEALYHYTIRQGRALDSQALIANAWHHRSDALSSIGTVLGIGGAILLGGPWTVLDPIASLIVAFLLLRIAWQLLREDVYELTDGSLPTAEVEEILDIARSFPAVSDPHSLHTRRIGNRLAVEFHVRMDGDMKLQDAHAIITDMEHRLKERFGAQTHVIIHMEPLKQATGSPSESAQSPRG